MHPAFKRSELFKKFGLGDHSLTKTLK